MAVKTFLALINYPFNSLFIRKHSKTAINFVVLACLLTTICLIGRCQELLWKRTFGGPKEDLASSIIRATDGGYVTVGYTRSFGTDASDVYLIEISEQGNVEWERTFGGSEDASGISVCRTIDGGYVVVGNIRRHTPPRPHVDVYLIKVNAKGDLEWERTFGGTLDENGHAVIQTADGGYMVVGWKETSENGPSDVYLIKTDSHGNLEWEKTFGGFYDKKGYSVSQTSDGGYVICGATRLAGTDSANAFLLKVDVQGTLQWERTFEGHNNAVALSVFQTADGGYVMVGSTGSPSDTDVYLVKTDPEGDLEWEKVYGGPGMDMGAAVLQTSDGGYLVAGSTNSFGAGGYDVYLVKIDPQGNGEWENTFGDTGDEIAISITHSPDGGCVVVGGKYDGSLETTYPDVLVMRFNLANTLNTSSPAGAAPWLVAWASKNGETRGISAVLVSPEGRIATNFSIATQDIAEALAIGVRDNVWLLAWEDSGYIWASRVGQDGRVLDSTPSRLSSIREPLTSLTVLASSSGWKIIWGGIDAQGNPSTEFVEIDLEGNVIGRGVLIDGLAAYSVAVSGKDYFAVAVSGGGGDGDILGAYGTFDGGKPRQIVVCDAYNDQDVPVVVSNGSSWLIAWEDYRYDEEGVFLYGTSADAAGNLSNPQGSCISKGFDNLSPAAASNGDSFLLAWVRRNTAGENATIALALMSSPESVKNTLSVKKLNCSYVSSPAVAFNSESYLVIWYEEASASCSRDFTYGIYGVRVSIAGEVLDKSPFLIAESINSPADLSVASSWELTPPSSSESPAKPRTVESSGRTLAEEYVNPFNERDILQLFEDGAASLTVAGFYDSATARWEKTDHMCRISLPDSTTLELSELPFALVSLKPLLLPVVWLRVDAPVPSYSGVTGEYRNTTGISEESLVIEQDGVFFLKEQGATGDIVEISGQWSISGNILTLKPEQTWYPERSGVVAGDYVVFKGFYDVNVWKKVPSQETSSTAQEELPDLFTKESLLQPGTIMSSGQIPSFSLEEGFAATEPLQYDNTVWLLVGPLIQRQRLLESKIEDLEHKIALLQEQVNDLSNLIALLEQRLVNLQQGARSTDMRTSQDVSLRGLVIAYVDAEKIFSRVFLDQVQAVRQAVKQKQQEIQQLQVRYMQGEIGPDQYQQQAAELQAELLKAQLTVDLTMLDKMIASPGFANFRSDLQKIKNQAKPLADEVDNLVQTAEVGIINIEGFLEQYQQLQVAFQQLDQLLTQVAVAKIVEIAQQIGEEGGYNLVLRKKEVLIYSDETVVKDISDEVVRRLRELLSADSEP